MNDALCGKVCNEWIIFEVFACVYKLCEHNNEHAHLTC